MTRKPHSVARNRPAEATGIAGAVALLVARAAGVEDPNLIVAIATVVGFLPAGITWVVELWRNRPGDAPLAGASV